MSGPDIPHMKRSRLLGVLDFADLYSELTKYGEVTAWEKLSA